MALPITYHGNLVHANREEVETKLRAALPAVTTGGGSLTLEVQWCEDVGPATKVAHAGLKVNTRM